MSKELHGLSILDAIESPHLLGASIRDPESFKPWLASLAAIFGLPLNMSMAQVSFASARGALGFLRLRFISPGLSLAGAAARRS